ncbi:MAG: hypothetical protein CME16_02635 [Gemmatimonadetes bacterium]|nr:hypothetical protein [Gemmatimonadota bacterium]
MRENGLLVASIFFAVMGLFGVGNQVGFVISVCFFAALGIAGMIRYLQLKTALPQGAGLDPDTNPKVLGERLDEIERRLTDVQDVMIALSEKFDRWEAANPNFK